MALPRMKAQCRISALMVDDAGAAEVGRGKHLGILCDPDIFAGVIVFLQGQGRPQGLDVIAQLTQDFPGIGLALKQGGSDGVVQVEQIFDRQHGLLHLRHQTALVHHVDDGVHVFLAQLVGRGLDHHAEDRLGAALPQQDTALVAQLFSHFPHGILHGEVVQGAVLVLNADVFQHLRDKFSGPGSAWTGASSCSAWPA